MNPGGVDRSVMWTDLTSFRANGSVFSLKVVVAWVLAGAFA
jgi:hypothetical protein